MVNLEESHVASRLAGGPESLVVLLHGRGANSEDLLPLAHNFAEFMPSTAFHLPNAPIPLSGFSGVFGNYEWFKMDGTDDPESEMLKAELVLNDYLDALLSRYNLDASRCVLLGFSQGTMLSLYAGPRRTSALGGILGFSGAMISVDSLRQGISSKPPVALIHGDIDPIVPLHASQIAADLLRKLGIVTELHVLPGLGHSIDRRGIDIAVRFMLPILSSSQPQAL